MRSKRFDLRSTPTPTYVWRSLSGIAGLFTVFSSFIFTTAIIKFLGSDISDLK